MGGGVKRERLQAAKQRCRAFFQERARIQNQNVRSSESDVKLAVLTIGIERGKKSSVVLELGPEVGVLRRETRVVDIVNVGSKSVVEAPFKLAGRQKGEKNSLDLAGFLQPSRSQRSDDQRPAIKQLILDAGIQTVVGRRPVRQG